MTALYQAGSAPLFVPTVGDFAQGMTTFVPLQLGQLATVPTGRELHAAIADHFAAIKDSFVTVAPYDGHSPRRRRSIRRRITTPTP